jgi:hypothetical protein
MVIKKYELVEKIENCFNCDWLYGNGIRWQCDHPDSFIIFEKYFNAREEIHPSCPLDDWQVGDKIKPEEE